MKILVLGGTVFLGRWFVDAALRHDHAVTIFNRGQHGAELFPEVERRLGDRDGQLDMLAKGEWDAVVDTCGYVPRIVRASAELLAPRVGSYTFVSSISVYQDLGSAVLDEAARTIVLEDESVETVSGETYGGLKALCEQEVERALPGRALIVRPGLIVGPFDGSDRFTYWLKRVSRGGEVLAPVGPDEPVEIIDVRDLADWMLRMVEHGKGGIFNATGPDRPLTLGEVLSTSGAVTQSGARVIWVDADFLAENGITPWVEMPLWVPGQAVLVDTRRALADGLTFRSLHDTVRDTLAWDAKRPSDYALKAGISMERERELLDRWHARPASE
jgi:2'-hydroxyisoflavone reductase